VHTDGLDYFSKIFRFCGSERMKKKFFFFFFFEVH
jgi:hypothetical protein